MKTPRPPARLSPSAPFVQLENRTVEALLPHSRALRVYLALLLYARRDSGEAWPSYRELQKRGKLTPKTLRAGLTELLELGLIEIKRRTGTSQLYLLHKSPRNPSPETSRREAACAPAGSEPLPIGR